MTNLQTGAEYTMSGWRPSAAVNCLLLPPPPIPVLPTPSKNFPATSAENSAARHKHLHFLSSFLKFYFCADAATQCKFQHCKIRVVTADFVTSVKKQ